MFVGLHYQHHSHQGLKDLHQQSLCFISLARPSLHVSDRMTSSHLKNSSASLSQIVLHSSYNNCKYFSAESVTNFSSLFPDLRCSQSSVLSGKSSPKSSPSNSGSHSGQKFCSVNFLDVIKLFWAQQRTLVLFLAPGFPLCCGAGLQRGLRLGVCAVLAVFHLFLVSVSSLLSSCLSLRSCSNFHFTRHVHL